VVDTDRTDQELDPDGEAPMTANRAASPMFADAPRFHYLLTSALNMVSYRDIAVYDRF
jgi:hypothetical protein